MLEAKWDSGSPLTFFDVVSLDAQIWSAFVCLTCCGEWSGGGGDVTSHLLGYLDAYVQLGGD